jgi:hypothetical protein
MRVAIRIVKAQACLRNSRTTKKLDGHASDLVFAREYARIVRAEGRRASHPVFGETVLSAHSSRPAHRYFDRGERAGLLTSESSSGPPFRPSRDSGISGAFVVRYSGATARDLHPVPYSPAAVTTGTLSKRYGPLHFVDLFKELHKMLRFSLRMSSMLLQPNEVSRLHHRNVST